MSCAESDRDQKSDVLIAQTSRMLSSVARVPRRSSSVPAYVARQMAAWTACVTSRSWSAVSKTNTVATADATMGTIASREAVRSRPIMSLLQSAAYAAAAAGSTLAPSDHAGAELTESVTGASLRPRSPRVRRSVESGRLGVEQGGCHEARPSASGGRLTPTSQRRVDLATHPVEKR